MAMLTPQTTVMMGMSIDNQFNNSVMQNHTREYWPTEGWRNSTPSEEGMSASILNDMLTFIEEQDYPIDSVFIVKNGYVVLEEYPSEVYIYPRKHELHSVTKSFTSTLIGIALQQGLIGSVDEYLLDFFPEYTIMNPDPRKNDITIEHLLTMSAGLEWDESSLPYDDPEVNDIGGMMASSDVVQYVLDKPMSHIPGEYWLYSGGVSTLLGAIIQQLSGYTTFSFAREFLFDPLGFRYPRWYDYPGGWYNTQGGLVLTTRDMAKLGFLYLNNGIWDGLQIISSDYVTNATYPHFTQLPRPPSYGGYGWQWWLMPDLETFMALGRMGQMILVSREMDLVVVFTAHIGDLDYDPEFDLYNDYILESILQGPDLNETSSSTSTSSSNQSNTLPTNEILIVSIPVSGFLILGVIIYLKRKKHS